VISDELYDAFRSDVVDTAKPYLWSEDEVWRYMNEAYRMFVRLTGGIPDFTSAVTQVPIVAGEALGELSPSLLRIMSARRASDGADIKIINFNELSAANGSDYGIAQSQWADNTPGPVRSMMIGAERNKARWVMVPVVDDIAQLVVYRTPAKNITGSGQKLVDVNEDHHFNLLSWMRHLAYQKQDAETFNRAKSVEQGDIFRGYCAFVKSEADRYKHKNRVVTYGGI